MGGMTPRMVNTMVVAIMKAIGIDRGLDVIGYDSETDDDTRKVADAHADDPLEIVVRGCIFHRGIKV